MHRPSSSLRTAMDFSSTYEIDRTVDFIRSGDFSKVALQFPDGLLKDSTVVAKALNKELGRGVRLYVMADTLYGSCCIDEVGASHVGADCVVHYGHACMSPTSNLPSLYIFCRDNVDTGACVDALFQCLSTRGKPVLVLFGLEFAHAIPAIRQTLALSSDHGNCNSRLLFADATTSYLSSLKPEKLKELTVDRSSIFSGDICQNSNCRDNLERCNDNTKHSEEQKLGGLSWILPEGSRINQFLLFWIGSDDSAFANCVLTLNNCEIVRFDAKENQLLEDTSSLKKILMRRYFLVEKAKDANIVGILVGTLGVAGYLHIIQKMKKLIEGAGKKTYIFVMGRPNPAKLANFPECDVFVYISCAQTALLDSKEFLAPVITPFEAMVAFNRGSQWTGEYFLDFQDIVTLNLDVYGDTDEARFSFLQGGYMEDTYSAEGSGLEQKERSIVSLEVTDKALCLARKDADSVLFKGQAESGFEYLAARSYQGLDLEYQNSSQSVIIGRTGKASGYEFEKK